MSEVRAVVFDVGGVLCPSPLIGFSAVDEAWGVPGGTVEAAFRGGAEFMEAETGRIGIDAFFNGLCARVSAAHGVAADPARLYEMFQEIFGEPVPEMIDLAVELRRAGYLTGLMSNIYRERRRWLYALVPGGVDVVVDSSEVGMRKPDPAIYEKLLEMLAVPAGAVAFVDDFAENVTAAEALGLRGIFFEDPVQVRAALIAAGVDIPPAASRR
ncbi:MAG TPA: HAD family phosphatase [Solirubrobacteraceae bacterium]|jgi:epoxide hydrolase-like predicted phosphatase|nr:HAD family phosphatase [Solirubrobacteraceae bacterium]